MKRKQFTAILLSLSLLFAANMPLNAISVFAAENTGEETTGTVAVLEEDYTDEVEATEAIDIPEEENKEGTEETEVAIHEEATEAVTVPEEENTEEAEATEAAIPEEATETAAILEEEDIEEAAFEDDIETIEGAAEGQTTEASETYGSESYPVLVIDDPPSTLVGELNLSLPASTKVTTTNVASGLKVRWEPVSGAREYVVYRGSKQIKKTSKTEITDTDVKSNNGSKYTYKVAAVSKNGTISNNVRTSTYYRLLPVGITSLKSTAAGKMTVTYDKNAKGSGYVVRFGLKSDMSDAKVITVTDPATTTKTFTGLQVGKTYYVQARSYKIENGTRYYSGYCTTKSVTIASSASSAQISFSGSQTIAVGTTRRLYVKNAGSAAVSVSKSSEAVKISKDSISYIITGNKAGAVTVNVTAGSVKKSFKITVLSDDQIAQRVYERVLNDCPGCRLWDNIREGKVLVIGMHLKSIGEGAIASDIRVNLQTGRAEIDLDQEFMDEWNIGVPKSFMVW